MKILTIEDDKDMQDFLKMGLESENYIVDCAPDGKEGSYLARVNDYDLIILDYSLPGKDGLTVCKEIRKAKRFTPILLLSGVEDTDIKISLLESGADDYMTKPFAFNELLARIKAILRRPRQIEGEELSVQDVTLNTSTQTVTRGRKGLYLTRKEFALLHYLMKNKGKVISRIMIMEHVWSSDSDPFSNTIEAHIRNLRKKLNTGDKDNLIYNIPGRGYKIE